MRSHLDYFLAENQSLDQSPFDLSPLLFRGLIFVFHKIQFLRLFQFFNVSRFSICLISWTTKRCSTGSQTAKLFTLGRATLFPWGADHSLIFLHSYILIFPQCNVRTVSKFKIQIWSTSKPLYAACKTFSSFSWPSVVQVLGQPDQEPQLCVRPREGEHRRLLPQCRRPDLHGRLQHVRPPAW